MSESTRQTQPADAAAENPLNDARSIDRAIRSIALPAFATLLTEPLYLLVDTAIVGHLGSSALGALAVANTIVLFSFAMFIFLTFNTAAFVATKIGAGETKAAADASVTGLWLALGLGVIAGGVTAAVGPTAIKLVAGSPSTVDPLVVSQATTYLRISAAGFPFLMLTMAAAGALRGHRDTRTPMWAAAVATIVNIALESAAILWLGFGIGASALATVLAQIAGTVVLMRRLVPMLISNGARVRPDWKMIRSQARAGWNLILRTIILRGVIAATVRLASAAGTIQLAAYQVAVGVLMFLIFGLDAIEAAAQVLVAEAIGGQDGDLAARTTARIFRSATILGCSLGAMTIASARVLPALFTQDLPTRTASVSPLIVVGFILPICAIAFAVDGLVVAGARTWVLAPIMAASAAVFALSIIASQLLTEGPLALSAILACLGLFMAVRSGLGVVFLQRSGWTRRWATSASTTTA